MDVSIWGQHLGGEVAGGEGDVTRRRIGALVSLVVLGNVLVFALAGRASAQGAQRSGTRSSTCAARTLVLSAMPLEMDPLLARADADLRHPIAVDGRPYVFGTLAGTRVIMGLTGIGPANAFASTTGAFSRFRCSDGSSEISDVVFSGTSGGDYIGDVAVPALWKFDGPQVALPAWASTALSRGVQTSTNLWTVAHDGVENGSIDPQLERSTPPGDPACACEATDQTQLPVTVEHTPQVLFPAAGLTTDPVAGRSLPCVPTGNDVFGCTPCRELDHDALSQTAALAEQVPPFVSPDFFRSETQSNTPATPAWQDEETAVVAAVAEHDGASFIGFRAASDGGGDRLKLPGFPSEFFVYRQLAANNAAATALAFLHRLSASG